MIDRRLTTVALLLGCLATPALAEDMTPPSVDLVAVAFIGFADGATAMLGPGETSIITQDGPGVFHGKTTSGIDFTFDVVEPEPCNFTATFKMNDQAFTTGFNVAAVQAIHFNNPKPEEGYVRYTVVLDGPDGMVEAIAADGSHGDAGKQSPIGTTIALDALNSAADALLARCSAK